MHLWNSCDVASDTLVVSKVNDVHIHIACENSIRAELMDEFSFLVPGRFFMPTFKNKIWDGKIRMYNAQTRLLPAGLLYYLIDFAKVRGYKISLLNEVVSPVIDNTDAQSFMDDITNNKYVAREYQVAAFEYCIKHRRALIVSPTGSGKSLIIYSLVKKFSGKKIIIVPTVSLVKQMQSDFIDYGCDGEDIHTISAGAEKETTRSIIISTWQSLYRLPKEYFEQYDMVIGDECHLFSSKEISSVMEKLTKCPIRFGFTGTLDNNKCNKLVLEGHFGRAKMFAKTKKLMDDNFLAQLDIKCMVLDYTDEEKKTVKKFDYASELDFIVRHKKRIQFVTNLAKSLEGNTLILFQFVAKHGKVLYNDILKSVDSNRPVFFIYGDIDADTREEYRSIIERSDNCIVVASYGTFSTGTNIRNLHNLILSSPYKSRIRNLQSIGRVLRVSETRDRATLYDIADNLQTSATPNITLKHFLSRVETYNEEGFGYRIYNVRL